MHEGLDRCALDARLLSVHFAWLLVALVGLFV
jgi:hypothetical protein